jgi:hypothetical protein
MTVNLVRLLARADRIICWKMDAVSGAGADVGGNYRRIASDGFGYAIGDDPARIENRDPFRERHDEPHMVFDEQHRTPARLIWSTMPNLKI